MRTLILLALVTIIGCTDHRQPVPTNEQLLIAGNWVVTEHLISDRDENNYRPDGGPSCLLDNYLKFTADGRVLVYEGPITCNTTDPAFQDIGTWTLNSDKTKLLLVYTKFIYPLYAVKELTISQLDKMTLMGKAISDQNGDGFPDYHKYTFTNK